MPITSSAEPVSVNWPSPLIASGKIAGHIIALAKPSAATKPTETEPVAANAPITSNAPRAAELNEQAADVAALAAGGHTDPPARLLPMNATTATASAQSGLERIRNEPVPIHYDLFIRGLAWFFGIMAFSRLDGAAHHPSSILVGILLMTTFIVAERLGRFIEQPMNNSIFDIPMDRICATITGNLLGAGHPLARPRGSDKATVWM